MLDEHNVNYNKHTIIQASDLKEKNLPRHQKYVPIDKSTPYSKGPHTLHEGPANRCKKESVEITLIQFRDNYYKYKGAAGASADKDVIGL
eukprot:11307515-Ditylum_brightwellii.AAC.1